VKNLLHGLAEVLTAMIVGLLLGLLWLYDTAKREEHDSVYVVSLLVLALFMAEPDENE